MKTILESYIKTIYVESIERYRYLNFNKISFEQNGPGLMVVQSQIIHFLKLNIVWEKIKTQ